jgi:hypothetical protein
MPSPAASMTSAVLGRTINGHSAGDLGRDDVLDNITLYWLTNTALSSAKMPRSSPPKSTGWTSEPRSGRSAFDAGILARHSRKPRPDKLYP